MTQVFYVGWDVIKALASGSAIAFPNGASGLAAADDLRDNDVEAGRLLAMRDDQVRAEAVARGEDPDALAEDMRAGMSAVFELHQEVIRLRSKVAALEGQRQGLSAVEHVRRVRCQADDLAESPTTWRSCCDTILDRLGEKT